MHDQTADLPADLLHSVLKTALTRVVESYNEFSSRLAPDNAKEFIVHHNACKAALAHLGSLIKTHELWRKQHGKSGSEAEQNVEALLLQAREILLATDNGNHDDNENQL